MQEQQGRSQSAPSVRAAPALQGPVELDNNKLIVVRLPAADMTADTEWEVVIVQNADVFRVEEEDVLNRRERKGEVPADADITGLSRLGDAVRIGDAQEIDGQPLVHEGAWRAKRDLVDCLKPIQIALCIIAFDDEAVFVIGEDKIANRYAARVEPILEAVSRVAPAREIELVHQEGFLIVIGE